MITGFLHRPRLVVELSDSHVNVTSFAAPPLAGPQVSRWPLPAGAGDWPERAARALQALGSVAPRGAEVLLLLPAGQVAVRLVRVPARRGRGRDRVLRFESTHHLPWPEARVVWSAREAVTTPAGAEFQVVAAEREPLEKLGAALESAGLVPAAMVPAAVALAVANAAPEGHESPVRLLLDARAETWTAIAVAGARAAVRPLGLPVRVSGASEPWAAGSRVGEIRRTLLGFERQHGLPAPAAVWAWTTAESRAEVEAAARELGWPLTIAAENGSAPSADLAVALAAEARWQGDDWRGLDLTPPAVSRRTGWRLRRGWYAVAAAIAVVGLLAPAVQLHRWAERANAKRVAIDRALAPVQARAARLQRAEEARRAVEAELARHRRFAEDRRFWLEWLALLEDSVEDAGAVWIERMRPLPSEGSELRVALAGAALAEADGEDSLARVRRLFRRLRANPLVHRIQEERLAPGEGEVLQFECTLALVGPEAAP